MKKIEKQIVEGVLNLFDNSRSKLGIVKTDRSESSHGFQHQWESIEYAFALELTESAFYESLTSAFKDIHSYKYIEDPTFSIALEKRLTAIGIPTEERKKAQEALEKIKKDFKGDDFEEKQAGWNINIDDIADMTRNANNRESDNSKPFTGGGPAPE